MKTINNTNKEKSMTAAAKILFYTGYVWTTETSCYYYAKILIIFTTKNLIMPCHNILDDSIDQKVYGEGIYLCDSIDQAKHGENIILYGTCVVWTSQFKNFNNLLTIILVYNVYIKTGLLLWLNNSLICY